MNYILKWTDDIESIYMTMNEILKNNNSFPFYTHITDYEFTLYQIHPISEKHLIFIIWVAKLIFFKIEILYAHEN